MLRAPQQGEALFLRGGNLLEGTQPFPGASGPSSDRCPGAPLGVLQTTPGCFPEKQAERSLAPSLPGLAAPYTRLALFGLTSQINCLTLKPHLWVCFWGNPNQDTAWRARVWSARMLYVCVCICRHDVCVFSELGDLQDRDRGTNLCQGFSLRGGCCPLSRLPHGAGSAVQKLHRGKERGKGEGQGR